MQKPSHERKTSWRKQVSGRLLHRVCQEASTGGQVAGPAASRAVLGRAQGKGDIIQFTPSRVTGCWVEERAEEDGMRERGLEAMQSPDETWQRSGQGRGCRMGKKLDSRTKE